MKKIFTTSIALSMCILLLSATFNSGCIKQCVPLSNDSVPTINDSLPDTDTTTIPPTDTTKIPPVDSTETPPIDSTQPPLDSVQSTIFGHWQGTYYDKNHNNPFDYDMYINDTKNSNGEYTMTFSGIIPSGGRTSGSGTWKLIGTTFSADITTTYAPPNDPNPDVGVEQLLFADYDGHNQTFTNGTWKDITIQTGSGYFEMKKIK